MSSKLRLFHRHAPVKVLGPYQRAVIWLQGCKWGCKGCIVPESWPETGGEWVSVDTLRHWVLSQDDIEGVTLSGGEPMLQAAGLVELIDLIREKRDLGVVCYTGYGWEFLQHQGNNSQQDLLKRIDLLIDGLYIQSQHDDLLWRGSGNQRLMVLSPRYQDVIQQLLEKGDRSVGLEFYDTTEGLYFSGVPNQVNFRQRFESKMRDKGIILIH